MENYVTVLKEARKQLMLRNNTVSVKDLTLCHRKKVFSILYPTQLADEELYDYLADQTGHDNIRRLFMVYSDRFRTEMEVQHGNIRGRIDVYDKVDSTVIDIKISKSNKVLLKPFKFHEKQVRYYMAMIDCDEGQIIYQMNNFGSYRSFSIRMMAEERKTVLEELKSDAQSLRNAIDAGNPFLVPGIDNDKEMNWMCKKCAYAQKCLTTRNIDENMREEIPDAN